MEVSEAVQLIIDAADQRVRKAYFPFKSKLAIYLKPFFPNFIGKISLSFFLCFLLNIHLYSIIYT
jgi:hypothetical protein